MAKAGMRRPDPSDAHGTESNHKMHLKKNDVPNVPTEIQGKAKVGKKKASPIEWEINWKFLNFSLDGIEEDSIFFLIN